MDNRGAGVPFIIVNNTREVWDHVNATDYMFVADEAADTMSIYVDSAGDYNRAIEWLSEVDAWPNRRMLEKLPV